MLRNYGFAVLLAAIGAVIPFGAIAQSIPIGRSSLTLPDVMRWTIHAVDSPELTYSGDRSGRLALDGKRLIYRSGTNAIRAIVVSRVTKGGVTGVSMSWSNNCPNIVASPFLYKRDRSSFDDVDCLVVVSVARSQEFIDSIPQLKKDLDGIAPDGNGLYYIQFTRSQGAGGYTFSQVLVSQDFKGSEGTVVEHTTRLPTALLAWAEQFAKNNRDAISSFTGNWSVPQLSFANE